MLDNTLETTVSQAQDIDDEQLVQDAFVLRDGGDVKRQASRQSSPVAHSRPDDSDRQSDWACAHGTGNSTPRAGKSARDPVPSGPANTYVAQADLDAVVGRLESLSKAAQAGDTTALDELRAALDKYHSVWWRLADLQAAIETKMAERIAQRNPLYLEAFRKRCSELRQQLYEGSYSMLVKMAASRMVACWFFCQFLELLAMDCADPGVYAKQLEHAERRAEAAVRMVAHAKRLELQLKLAGKAQNR